MSQAPALLRVSFDVDQIGGALVWHLDVPATHRSLYCTTGPFAGSVHFAHDDQVFVEVLAFGRLGSLVGSRVLEACLITLPHTGAGRFSGPSPFSQLRATQPVGPWSDAVVSHEPERDLTIVSQTSLEPLAVIARDGRWDLRMVVTAEIEQKEREGTSRYVRVFAIDPEAEVGTGTDPHHPRPWPATG